MLRNVKYLINLSKHYHGTAILATKKDIGVRHRMKLERNDTRKALEMYDEDPEFDPDSDFFEASSSHRQYEKEMIEYKDKLGRWIVRDKYFKRKSLNFLTWGEKEQIRHLHEKSPDEWSVERLCESFPIDIHHIKRLLKNKWTPNDPKRVEKHDSAVKRNWELLRKGEFDNQLDPDMKSHLMKFKDREINLDALPKFEPKQRLCATFKTNNDEFARIITSCKKYQQVESPEEINVKQIEPRFETRRNNQSPDSKILLRAKEINTNKRITLDELKRLLGDQDEPETIKIDEKELELHSQENPAGTGIISEAIRSNESSLDFPNKFDNRVATHKELLAMAITPVKERIRIPKKLWKKGATYKYKDCFYDDDGELLYRVPGLTK